MYYKSAAANYRLAYRVLVFGQFSRRPADITASQVKNWASKHKAWLRSRTVQGIAVGKKVVEGGCTGETCVQVFVDRKRVKSRLSNPVPKRVRLGKAGSFVTDVVEIGELRACNATERVRPMAPGLCIGAYRSSSGTAGPLVRAATDDAFGGIEDEERVRIMSAGHVFWDPGSSRGVVRKVEVLQSSLDYDGQVDRDSIGSASFFREMEFSLEDFPNSIDAMMVELKPSLPISSELFGLGVTPSGIRRSIKKGDRVTVCGFNGASEGEVTIPDFSANMKYLVNGRLRRAGLHSQVMCSCRVKKGDSGACVIDDEGKLVGMLVGKTDDTAVFTPWRNLEGAFNVELAQ